MSRRVARRRGQRKLQRVERAARRAAQVAVEATLQAEIAAVVQRIVEQALADEVTALVGRARYERRQVATPVRTTAVCSGCQIGWATRVWRAGSYERTLVTIPAAAYGLLIPTLTGLVVGFAIQTFVQVMLSAPG